MIKNCIISLELLICLDLFSALSLTKIAPLYRLDIELSLSHPSDMMGFV